jgi:outer membrane protein insertion porin family
MRAVAAALAAAALALAPVRASADVGDYLGKIVSTVRLELEGVETLDARLLAVVETRAGQPLSMMEVRESITHLFSLGLFDDVAVDAALEAGRVALRYQLTPMHIVTRIDFAGDLDQPDIDLGQLRQVVVTRFGSFPPVRRAQEAAGVVADQLRERGYLHAAVTAQAALEHATERATLTFTIQPGVRTRIGAVAITGVPQSARQSVLNELNIVPGAPFERAMLAQQIEAYVARRRARGFYEAAVTVSPQLADQDRVANLTLDVAPGPHVRVVFAGDPVPASLQEQFVPVEREGSSDEDLLEDSSNRIEEYFRAQGYQDAAAPHTRQEANGELLLTFTVNKGPQYRVSHVEVAGNTSVPLGAFAAILRLREDQPFSGTALDADLEAIKNFYRRRGFASVRAEAAFERDAATADADPGQLQTVVRITIREGVQTTVGSVRIEGNDSLPEQELRPRLAVQPGQPFVPQLIAGDRDQILLQYANRGYANATVDAEPGLSADGTRADVVYVVREGARTLVDHILIVGNVRTRADTIERELTIKPGDPLGLEAVNETQRRLSLLGLFRRTRLTELRHGDETTRDLVVTVEEAPVTTVDYGGGVEAGERVGDTETVARTELDVAPRAFFGVTRRNLFGKNRSVTVFGRISPHFSGTSGRLTTTAGKLGFTEYRLLGSFREPRVLDTAADASLTAVIEQQRRASFNFGRKSAIVEAAKRFTPNVSASASYQVQQTKLFDLRKEVAPSEQLLIDRLFPQLRLSSASSSIARDTRDDAVEPSGGGYLSANGELAARRIGSEVGFGKLFFSAQRFRVLPRTNRIVLAGNVRVGLATGFPRDVPRTDSDGSAILGPDGEPLFDRVKDLPASERFFAGGDTMRGFALDQLGAPETIDKNGFPIGGNALLIMNVELRVPMRSGLGVVGFVDGGNVFARARDFSLAAVRTAAGFGVRYRSPIGPIRVDLGFKLRRQATAGGREGLTAIHISLGQAF